MGVLNRFLSIQAIMNYLALFIVCFATIATTSIMVPKSSDRQLGFCCGDVASKCAVGCAGKDCSIRCSGTCGIFGTTCSYTCSQLPTLAPQQQLLLLQQQQPQLQQPQLLLQQQQLQQQQQLRLQQQQQLRLQQQLRQEQQQQLQQLVLQ